MKLTRNCAVMAAVMLLALMFAGAPSARAGENPLSPLDEGGGRVLFGDPDLGGGQLIGKSSRWILCFGVTNFSIPFWFDSGAQLPQSLMKRSRAARPK